MGLLDGLTDPVVMAAVEKRYQIVTRLAEQMGVTRDEARQALFHFETVITSEGQTLQ